MGFLKKKVSTGSKFQLYAIDKKRQEDTMEAKVLIMEADRIAKDRGLTQSKWSRLSGHASNGQTISRIISKGNCRLSTFLNMLNAIGCRLEIQEVNGGKEED